MSPDQETAASHNITSVSVANGKKKEPKPALEILGSDEDAG
ncbi:MAG TPA: hypothetical protein VFD47_11280 [Actinomycetota bacterium]|nr:hypothetical protein [Actinomycetota bacterium]